MRIATLVCGLVAVAAVASACNSSHRGGGGMRRDGGVVPRDAACPPVSCETPPMGCRYVEDPADPCSCGILECPEVCCGCETPVFPTFDVACGGDDDCFLGLHQVDCCGTQVALGVAASDLEPFEAAEAVCRGMYPGCGCPPGPVTTEDGSTCVEGVTVHCVAGLCRATCAGVGM